jgi:hypothetical protein
MYGCIEKQRYRKNEILKYKGKEVRKKNLSGFFLFKKNKNNKGGKK